MPRNQRISTPRQTAMMAPISLADIVSALPSEDSWGPPTPTDTTLNGVPYAPYSKGDKLGRMADWTTEGKDGRDGRGGRQQYNRNYRGKASIDGFHISPTYA
jgi:translation initiation factor 3 subunit D